MNTTETTTHGVPFYKGHGTWRRLDTSTTTHGFMRRTLLFAAGRADDTPQHMIYPSGYDERCSCCRLNFSHTEACHQQEIETVQQTHR